MADDHDRSPNNVWIGGGESGAVGDRELEPIRALTVALPTTVVLAGLSIGDVRRARSSRNPITLVVLGGP
ncbi:hypothetical protein [Natronorubrum halophilum]|uniref:hypothetical protein n=1 Tax=Natronorubrum halophilum TaxID=1702106 RepID=UPI000EF6F11B|nr:hypothetical protein [Natronorubrum halophilum]